MREAKNLQSYIEVLGGLPIPTEEVPLNVAQEAIKEHYTEMLSDSVAHLANELHLLLLGIEDAYVAPDGRDALRELAALAETAGYRSRGEDED